MPRRPRIHLNNVPLHIVQRGHNRAPCFFAEEDYYSYLHWLGEALKETGCALHAYALMTNHVHLLVTPRMDAYRGLFRTALDQVAIDDIRLAFNQNQPLGDSRFYTKIERILGERRQAKPRGRPKRAGASSSEAEEIQGLLKLE